MGEKSVRPAAGKNAISDDGAHGGARPALVVGIGAAAGDLASLRKILAGMPSGRGIAIVLVYRPKSAGKKLLARLTDHTGMAVLEATEEMPVLADRIHVMPPDKFLSIAADRLTLREPVHCNGLLMPIDHFFCALAADRKSRCCGIVLAGTGSDGMLGLSEIRAAGGRTITEDRQSGRRPGLPQSAAGPGAVDTALPAGAIAGALAELADRAATRNGRAVSQEPGEELVPILEILRARAGHDFSCYKPGTLVRRIRRRMALERIDTLDGYARHLADHPDAAGLLLKDLLIGVTDFFRQPHAWKALERKVIAPLVENAAPGTVIRVWIPGCSSGREVYSLAILLAEAAGSSARPADFQIFATDADEAALATARLGAYSAAEIGPNVSPERLKRFFSRRDGRYQAIKSLRERVVFAAQNLTADPPFSRMDLIICRNLLIYLDQQIQRKILSLFHFALRDGGFLFLGNAETVGDREDLFEPVMKKWRIYRRIGVGRWLSDDFPLHSADASCALAARSSAPARPSLTSTAHQVLLDRFAPACVIIDRKHQVLYTHGTIERYLTLPAGEWTTLVTGMVREGLRVRLRAAIGKCIENGRTVSFTARIRRGEKSVAVKTTAIPLKHLRGSDGLMLITFEDQRFPVAKTGGQTADGGDVLQLVDELKVTREELQSTIDELECSNDQLKAANEEVMAANEELQSANEEMETSKAELQSLNEELNTINVRLQEKVDELESVNNDVVNLLASTSIATVFLDKAFRIKRYTPAVTRLMALIPSDQGRPLGDILLRFADEALLGDARRVLVDLTPLAAEVQADDGRWYVRRITPYRTQHDRIEGVVLTFIDITESKQAEEALRAALERAVWLARFPGENPHPVVRVSADGTILYCNPASARNRNWLCSAGKPLPEPILPLVAAAMAKGEAIHHEVPLGDGVYALTIMPFPAEAYLNVYGRSITKRRQAEETLRRSEERLRRAQEIAHLGSWELDLTSNRLFWSDEVYRIFGFEPQEFAATYEAFLERVHPEDRGAVDAAYSGSLRENRDTYWIEHRVIHARTGEVRIVHERCQHYRDESGRIVRSVGMVHDITERKRTEEALRESEVRVRLKLQSILSPAGDIGDLELADIIDAAAIQSLMDDFYELARIPMAIIDLKGKVIVGAGWQEICTKFHRVHPETCSHCVESDTELSSGIPPGRYKLYKCKNNLWDVATPIVVGGRQVGNVFSGQFFFDDERIDYRFFREQAARYGFDKEAYIAALDNAPRLNRDEVETAMAFFMKFADLISQMSYANIELARLLAERDALMTSLVESEERLRLFIEHAPAALAMFDRQMRYLSVSHRWRSDYGLEDADLIGASHYDVIPDIPPKWKENHRRGLAGEVLRAEADRFPRADGTVKWTRWEIRPWYDASGGVGGIVIFSEDITEMMQTHEALETRSAQLTATNLELESFSYSVSHDLQAPLRAIDGYSRLILRKHGERFDEDARAKFNVIQTNAQMMGRLIEDLLAFSRLGKAYLSLMPLEMGDLTREVWEEIRAAHPERRLTLRLADMPPALADRSLIRQVLVNLLSNAVKFTRERPEALIEVGGGLKDGECVYMVRDNGIGFDMQYHDKLFGVFQRLHRAEEYEGTGVGLAIVQRIVHRHGGRIWAEGEIGKGACLYFSLSCPTGRPLPEVPAGT